MKGILRTFLALLIIALVDQTVSYSYSYSYGSTIVGDIRIYTLNNGSIYCDSLICPDGTHNCKVSKQNDPNNFQVILRHRVCKDANGAILAEEQLNEPNVNNVGVNEVVSTGGGTNSFINGVQVQQLSPQQQREFEEGVRRTQERVQAQITESMNQINTQLRPFLDGTFQEHVNNQIRSSIPAIFQ